jgi:hypothetical protein
LYPPVVDCDRCDKSESYHHHHPKCPTHCGQQDFLLSDGVCAHLEHGKEINKDIVLEPNPFKDCGTISGIIKDKNGRPIKNALVKVFDLNHRPVMHVFTNSEGQFLFCLSPGKYIIKAVR